MSLERLPNTTGGSSDVVHLLIYAFQGFWCPFEDARGCPPPEMFFPVFSTLMLSGAFRSGLKIKASWLLKSQGKYLSNAHKNIYILSNNAWEKPV